MQYVKPDISTICFGQAASAAAVLLAAGTPGKRLALPHARILLHQPYAEAYGQATDIELAAKEIMRMRTLLEEILAHHTGQAMEKIHQDTDRDFVMSAEEAKDYGIIDEVIEARELADNSRADRRGPVARAQLSNAPETGGETTWRSSETVASCSSAPSAASPRSRSRSSSPGPGVYICDECIDLCNEIIEEELAETIRAALRRAAQAP